MSPWASCRRALGLAIAVGLCALGLLSAFGVPVAHAESGEVSPVGDGGSVGVRLQNRTVHPMRSTLGSTGDAGVELVLGRYADGRFTAQCIDGTLGSAPDVVLSVEGRRQPIEVPPITFDGGPPALWVARERLALSALEAIVAPASGARLQHLSHDAVPGTFAALRFAPLILISASDFATLEPDQQHAIRDAVNAGVTLVVGTGEAGAPPDALAALSAIGLGAVSRPVGAVADRMPKAAAVRRLEPGAGATTPVLADGRPVMVQTRRGLGQVRVLSVRLADVPSGPIADAVFAPPEQPLGHVLQWLAQAPPPDARRASPFGGQLWLVLLLLVGVVAVARRRPRLGIMLAVPWWVLAVLMPPQFTDTRLDSARALYLPVPEGALVVGTLDLTLTRGGPRTLTARTGRVALEDARPGGGCLVGHADAAGWIVDGQPGSTRRLTFFALVDAAPEGDDKLTTLAAWPSGPLAGATVRRVEVDSILPIGLEPARIDAARVDPALTPAPPPLVLESMP